jgi:uncharacterized protein
MSVELLPLGFRCNLRCAHCYQEPVRQAGLAGHPRYDLPAMLETADRLNQRFTVFGGEPLLVPVRDLEILWRHGYERFGGNGIQTNGVLLTDEHIALMKRYRVSVGVSCEGPGALNDIRWAGSLEATREATAKTQRAIERLLAEGLSVSLIVTLYRGNATADRRPILIDWLRDLERQGLQYVNLHPLEVDDDALRETAVLDPVDLADTWLAVWDLERTTRLRVEPVRDVRARLAGDLSQGSCVFQFCDPMTTRAVQGIDGQGRLRNCGRVYKDGVPLLKPAHEGFERTLALYYTPQSYGGCQGCRFFLVCGGGNCPGTGEHGDTRGRTEHCAALMRLYEALEADLVREGVIPLSLSPDRERLERAYVDAWRAGRPTPGESASGGDGHGDVPHGDHTDARQPHITHGDTRHGDRPHGDAPHGDHTDVERPVYTHGDHTDVTR